MKLIKRLQLVLATGFILYFFSERMFWSMYRPGDGVLSYVLTPFLYALYAYILLIIVDIFRVKSPYAIFLTGALFGWLGEGIVAMTLFGSDVPFPLSISWTGLAWHALITVYIGWYLMMRALNESSYRRIIAYSVALGIFWGMWSLGWAFDSPPVVASFPAYALHAFLMTALLVGSYTLFSRSDPAGFHATKTELYILSTITALYFVVVTVPTVPLAILVIPILFLALYIHLRKNRASEASGSFLNIFNGPIQSKSLWPIFLMSLVATGVYGGLPALGITLFSNPPILIALTVLGFVGLIWSAVVVFSKRSATVEAQ